jgi:dihydrofolate reductase
MRKIFLFMTVSLDGYFEGPDHDLSWHHVDDEFNQFAIEQLRCADVLLFGRRTYQLMEESWPNVAADPEASSDDREIGHLINNVTKIVLSRTLKNVEEKEHWRNVSLATGFDPEEIRRLKEEPGKGIWVGGSGLAETFIRAGLIDEFRFMVNPVVIGRGTPIFKALGGRLDLELLRVRPFKSGNVLLCYRPAGSVGPPP